MINKLKAKKHRRARRRVEIERITITKAIRQCTKAKRAKGEA
jgi:hypothetical protein